MAARALRPGGKLLVMEHVAAEDGTATRLAPRAFAPVFEIVGNGCKFRRTADAIRAVAPGLFEGLDIDEFLAPVPIPFLRPHIIAKATRAAS